MDSFKKIIVDYPIGSVVLFQDGNVGIVTEAEKSGGKCEIIASLFGGVDMVGEERDFASEEVFVGTRRINELEQALQRKRQNH